MNSMNDIAQRTQVVFDALIEHYGNEEGPFSNSLARVLAADTKLDEIGLGPKQLGIGINWRAGPSELIVKLAAQASEGDADSFDAAMRYFGHWVMSRDDLPQELAFLLF
jgi:hypothetical protein